MRAVIYARYSSENQRAASIEDQLEVCRRFIDRQKLTLGRVYKDAAMSGSSRFRPDYQMLLNDLDRHQFDVVVVEALDRYRLIVPHSFSRAPVWSKTSTSGERPISCSVSTAMTRR